MGKQHVVLDSLRHLIDLEPDMRVMAPSDVTLFDLDDSDDSGVFDELRQTAETSRTIVLSIASDPADVFQAFKCGAAGLVSKRESPPVLLTAIRRVHAGEAWVGRTMAARLLDLARTERRSAERMARSTPAGLTARDRELIALVGAGWRNADIARHLAASEATVRACLSTIFRKLGVQDRFALMLYASEHGFASALHRSRPHEPQ